MNELINEFIRLTE